MSYISSLPDLADPYASTPPEPDVPNAGQVVIRPVGPGPVG
jgi:hypothetical protein